MNLKKTYRYFFILIIIFVSIPIIVNSTADLYLKKDRISEFLIKRLPFLQKTKSVEELFASSLNNLQTSSKSIPPIDINDLVIEENADIYGQWSAPFDWNVTPIHSVLLPNYKILTFGTFGVEKKEDKDIRANKKITLTDGRVIYRDIGGVQWIHHDVNSGIDFDIWDPKNGVLENSHVFIRQPVVMDAFCTVARVISPTQLLLVGGNKNIHTKIPDTQNATVIFDFKKQQFLQGPNLNYKRWYGSAVKTGDNKLVIMGGVDVTNTQPSITPEILDLEKLNLGWKPLIKATSKDLFGDTKIDEDTVYSEWNYPRAFLTSQGNIVGISYNKLWVMDKNNDFRIHKTSEIPLTTGGLKSNLEFKHPNNKNKTGHFVKFLTQGSPVGNKNTAIMHGKDKILVFGGDQEGFEYSPTNKVLEIDFSDNFSPKIKNLTPMTFPRADLNVTVLPNGKLFINGGYATDFDDEDKISILTPEIYDPYNLTSNTLAESHTRRDYHSSSILLPDGRILTGGGNVWNAEIFYPPYLFEKNWNNETVLAKRPEIFSITEKVSRDVPIFIKASKDTSRFTLISTGSVTHAQASESKFKELSFKKNSDLDYEITLPSNINEIQDGSYILFAINHKGVPSEGKIIYVD